MDEKLKNDVEYCLNNLEMLLQNELDVKMKLLLSSEAPETIAEIKAIYTELEIAKKTNKNIRSLQ